MIKKIINIKFLSILILLLTSFYFSSVKASVVDIELRVNSCNNNTVCETSSGEDYESCPNDCPAPPDPGPDTETNTTTSGGFIKIKQDLSFSDFNISSSETRVEIKWGTNYPTLTSIKWGNTPNYESSVFTETSFVKDHIINISGLLPNTRYYYYLESRDKEDRKIYKSSFFVTPPLKSEDLPKNIFNLTKDETEDGIRFVWDNPAIDDFSSVRIVKLRNRFSYNPLDGHVIYEGGKNTFFDYDFNPKEDYYYSFFVRNTKGKYSSGVFIRAGILSESFFNPLDSDKGTEYEINIISDVNLNLKNIFFLQNNILKEVKDDQVILESDKVTEIFFDKELVPEKSIIIIKVGPSYNYNQGVNFIFTRNEETGEYRATLPEVNFAETHVFEIRVFNKNFNEIKNIKGEFVFLKKNDSEADYDVNIFYILLVLIVLILIIIFLKKKKKIVDK